WEPSRQLRYGQNVDHRALRIRIDLGGGALFRSPLGSVGSCTARCEGLYGAGWNSSDCHKRWNITRHQGTRADRRVLTDGHWSHDHRSDTDDDMVTNSGAVVALVSSLPPSADASLTEHRHVATDSGTTNNGADRVGEQEGFTDFGIRVDV